MSFKSEITKVLKDLKLDFTVSTGSTKVNGQKYNTYDIDLSDNQNDQYTDWYEDAWKALSKKATEWGGGIDENSFNVEIAIPKN